MIPLSHILSQRGVYMNKKIIALAGNPNVGKSTVFNALTGMHQHTGNWPGKTVSNASGQLKYNESLFEFVDLPGAYSLDSASPDEIVTSDYIHSGKADLILIIADATCLHRNLLLAKDILSITGNAIFCVNLMDEAEKKGICINIKNLEDLLQIPVVPMTARSKKGLDELLKAIDDNVNAPDASEEFSPVDTPVIDPDEIFRQCVTSCSPEPHDFDRKLDKIVTSRIFGFPLMFILLLLIFWLTMTGANYPSSVLSSFFSMLEEHIRTFLEDLSVPSAVTSLLMDGLYTTLTWVISVMLPPMAIFFPLFTLLEDLGYLPRIAFNLDSAFRRCGAHGKQSLTMCMGFGCNACGVMGCRIIESPRERLIAILTNVFVPCNGRFPTLIAIILIFFVAGFTSMKSLAAGVMLTAAIIFGILMTLAVSKLLSCTLLKGIPSSFVLELPPYRKPQIGSVIIRSILDRTVFVLGRAIVVAAPAGIIIWILANVKSDDISLLDHFTCFLDPFGQMIGVDGVIVAAFILGLPANEIVIPIMLMCYMSSGMLTDYSSLAQLQEVFTSCGWTGQTALCVMVLCLFHFPCGTTCLTIKKETGSLKWTALGFILPTMIGIILCFIINMTVQIPSAMF